MIENNNPTDVQRSVTSAPSLRGTARDCMVSSSSAISPSCSGTVKLFWVNIAVMVCGILMVYSVIRISAGQNVRFYQAPAVFQA